MVVCREVSDEENKSYNTDTRRWLSPIRSTAYTTGASCASAAGHSSEERIRYAYKPFGEP
jgi:hypothetical protein